MALLNVNAADARWGCVPASGAPLGPALDALPPGRPVTIMIHGYRFCPHDAAHDPHRHVLALAPRRDCWKALSWPRHLHLDRAGAGLGIGFGWHARGALPDVADRARGIGGRLARLIAACHAARPDAPIHVIAHSLGARVALTALAAAPPGAVRRVILMSGAAYRAEARSALASPGASACAVLNVITRGNAPFDLMFRLAAPPARLADLPLAAGLSGTDGAIDLRIDAPATRAALETLGHRIPPPRTRICHWSGYLRPGLFAVYRRMFDPDDPDFPDRLRSALGAASLDAATRLALARLALPHLRPMRLPGRVGGNPYPPRGSSGV